MRRIAILVENSRAYGRAMIEGIADFAQVRREWILRPVSPEDVFGTDFRGYDGIIARIADDRLAERLLKARLPIVDVFCQKNRAGMAGVDSDHQAIGRLAREFFLSRGFTNLAYCGFPGTAFSDARERAFSDAATHVYARGDASPSDESQFYDERVDRVPDAKRLLKWIRALPKPVAVFCCNDLRAIQLQHVALQNGLIVPRDVSILGVDDDTIACSFAEVPISSINPHAFRVGYDAARILQALILRPPAVKPHRIHTVKPGEIIERASTEYMPIDPPWLGNALMHIERNMRRPVTAAEIFALSERSGTYVENIFREKLGMSVQAYVTSVKMREARRLLSSPDLRISEISDLCGFTSPQYFCRTFTATFGKSPRSFRTALSIDHPIPNKQEAHY